MIGTLGHTSASSRFLTYLGLVRTLPWESGGTGEAPRRVARCRKDGLWASAAAGWAGALGSRSGSSG